MREEGKALTSKIFGGINRYADFTLKLMEGSFEKFETKKDDIRKYG